MRRRAAAGRRRCGRACVVHVLEAVEVDEEQCETGVVALGCGRELLEAVGQQEAVGQAGEEVVMRHVPDAGLGRLRLGNVGEGADGNG